MLLVSVRPPSPEERAFVTEFISSDCIRLEGSCMHICIVLFATVMLALVETR